MVNTKIDSGTQGSVGTYLTDWTVESREVDGVNDQDNEWTNSKFPEYFGYYKTIPEVKIAIDMRAIWTIGNEIKAKNPIKALLDNINGWGQDTFRTILKSMLVMKRVAGDSFAEIINKDGRLINLKPLNPANIKIVVDRKGLIKHYELINKPSKIGRKFKPNEILHFSNKRIADEIHGVSDIEAIEEIIKANQESFFDMKLIQHRFVRPMMKFVLDTDDQTEIDEFMAKNDNAMAKGDNMYIPKGLVEHELVSVPSNATLNPLPWREHLRNYFFQVVGIPQIILGSSGEFTESTAKIAYLAFEQSVKDEQKEIIEQLKTQLGINIELSFPASLKNELLSDEAKDNNNLNVVQKNDLTAGLGR